MADRKKDQYSDISNAEKSSNYLMAEEYPEGPYGAPQGSTRPVENKSGNWGQDQRYYSAFNYEMKTFHQDIERQEEGAHPVHDDPKRES
ncbi:cytosolic protein [Mesobacillus zeae]|uniref:Cytosolic protein n=1 Tax=Mesobacillus zeae TaxID=1917180 RepID=A0A398BM98_9BACI|nr:cytosolic protein [Mesobacillus zeae]RID88890.1 cytosolic protein [Mesobacillus zeae]